MDLFPDGGFVRLRSRARDKYIHADEDATSVSLRPLGAVVASRNVDWEVKLCSVEGVIFVLLQGATNGRYLAASDEDEPAPFGHRGVRAVQRHSDSPHLEVSFRWLAIGVEAGQNYVRLHNTQGRCLRANGKHRRWNNLVTVDVMNGNDTTMRQWRVEAIPSTPEALPLPPQPQPPFCRACLREGSGTLCRPCIERMKGKLLADARTIIAEERIEKHYYCLRCQEIVSGRHSEHRENCIPFGPYKGEAVAWVTGEEQWKDIFQGVHTQDRAVRPNLLNKSNHPRCSVCRDTISGDSLYGELLSFCSLKCYVAGSLGQKTDADVEAMVSMDCSEDTIGVCVTCGTAVMRGESHKGHDWLRIRSDAGLKPRVVIPNGHPKELAWASIQKQV